MRRRRARRLHRRRVVCALTLTIGRRVARQHVRLPDRAASMRKARVRRNRARNRNVARISARKPAGVMLHRNGRYPRRSPAAGNRHGSKELSVRVLRRLKRVHEMLAAQMLTRVRVVRRKRAAWCPCKLVRENLHVGEQPRRRGMLPPFKKGITGATSPPSTVCALSRFWRLSHTTWD